MNEDEWAADGAGVTDGAEEATDKLVATEDIGNGSPAAAKDGADVTREDKSGNKLVELKRCLVDNTYGTEFGFRAGPEVRAEVSELVNQLEAANPIRAPNEAPGVLDGNWILL